MSADAVDEVKRDLASIRQQLHQFFGSEDQLRAELAQLAVNHFPELVMQYPEFHLNNAIVSHHINCRLLPPRASVQCSFVSVLSCVYLN